MKPHHRRQIMIDQPVQGALTARVAIYWVLGMGATLFAGCVWDLWYPAGTETNEGPPRLLPAILGSLIVLPIAIVDMIRVSNRFVGPVHSLRNQLKCLSLGDKVEPLVLREGDYWNDLVKQFNEVVRVRIQSQQVPLSAELPGDSEPSTLDPSVSDHCDCPSVGSVPADVDSSADLRCSSR